VSAAEMEFVIKRCEEILDNDSQYQQLNIKLLEMEKEIFPMLSDEAKAIFLKIDALNMKLINHIYTTINLR
jgi:hypothetical protein